MCVDFQIHSKYTSSSSDSSCLCTSALTTLSVSRMLAASSFLNCCNSNQNPACKYRVRLFYSKGALLLLVRTLLFSIVGFSATDLMSEMITRDFLKHYKWTCLTLPVVLTLISFPLSGWLADAKYGNQKINRLGSVLLAISTVLYCLFIVIESLLFQNKDAATVLNLCCLSVIFTIFLIGICMFIVTIVQFGLDQMPDASTSSITSFIAWLVFSLYIGYWISDFSYCLKQHCMSESTAATYNQIWSLCLVLLMATVLIADFLLSPKWLIIEPESPQSLKTIYHVLKFAVKHKAPVSCSAFTYWEEEIPSRIDLGKTKYGGPFTTEQVEDVKTTLRMLFLSLSLLVVVSSVFTRLQINIKYFDTSDISNCSQNILYTIIYNPRFYAVVMIVLQELIIHPLAGRYIPNTLTRIGIVSFFATYVSFQCLILQTIHHFYTDTNALETAINLVYFVSTGFLEIALLTAILEFVCAQSPYKLKGLIISHVLLTFLVGTIIGNIIYSQLVPTLSYYLPTLIKTLFCLFGFVLHCFLARWYKKRVREDVYSTQQVVEEVYDRYLSSRDAVNS